MQGELEVTMATIFARRANFKRWLTRSDLSKEMQIFRDLLSGVVEAVDWAGQSFDEDPENISSIEIDRDMFDNLREGHHANFRHRGVIYSRQSTHVGNSLIAFEKEGKTFYGSIQSIVTLKSQETVFEVKPYHPLSADIDDAFSRYAPHFPAQLVSSREAETEYITKYAIKSHCARYWVSKDSILMIKLSRVSGLDFSCFIYN